MEETETWFPVCSVSSCSKEETGSVVARFQTIVYPGLVAATLRGEAKKE